MYFKLKCNFEIIFIIYSYYGKDLKNLLEILKQLVVNVWHQLMVLLINLSTLVTVTLQLLLNGRIV